MYFNLKSFPDQSPGIHIENAFSNDRKIPIVVWGNNGSHVQMPTSFVQQPRKGPLRHQQMSLDRHELSHQRQPNHSFKVCLNVLLNLVVPNHLIVVQFFKGNINHRFRIPITDRHPNRLVNSASLARSRSAFIHPRQQQFKQNQTTFKTNQFHEQNQRFAQ